MRANAGEVAGARLFVKRGLGRAKVGEVDDHLYFDALVTLFGELQAENLAQGQPIGAHPQFALAAQIAQDGRAFQAHGRRQLTTSVERRFHLGV